MSVPYKSKGARIKDKFRKMWRKPGVGPDTGPYSTGGGDPKTGSAQIPYKPKPPRKGRPDGA